MVLKGQKGDTMTKQKSIISSAELKKALGADKDFLKPLVQALVQEARERP